MSPDPKNEYAAGPGESKECPVCDQEFNGTCPLHSSDCPFVYDDPPKDLDLDDEDDETSLVPDFGLDDDFDEEDEEADDLLDGDLDEDD